MLFYAFKMAVASAFLCKNVAEGIKISYFLSMFHCAINNTNHPNSSKKVRLLSHKHGSIEITKSK